jgi:hypothetical protein
VSETHEQSNTITDHPVEQDSDISDHVKADPNRITLECFVTNHPIHPATIDQFKADGGEFKTLDIDIPQYRVPLIDTSGPIPTIGSPTRVVTQGITDIGSAIGGALFGKPKITTLQFPDGDLNRPQKAFALLSDLRDDATLVNVVTLLRMYENMVIEHFNTDRSVDTGSGVTFSITFRLIKIVSTQTVTGVVVPKVNVPRAAAAVDAGKKGLEAPNISLAAKGVDGVRAGFEAMKKNLGL